MTTKYNGCKINDYTVDELEKLAPYGCKGLNNIGNTCFFNSIMQAFINTPEIIGHILSKSYAEHLNKSKPEHLLVEEFHNLMSKYHSEKGGSFSPNVFHEYLNVLARETDFDLNIGIQNDVGEFLSFIINSLHNGISFPIKSIIRGEVKTKIDKIELEAAKAWSDHFKDDFSPLIPLFYGQFISTVRCTRCGNENIRAEPVSCLSLEIPRIANPQDEITLDNCLDSFTNEERLTGENRYSCEKCNMKTNAVKSMAYWHLPKIMVIQIKRFRYTASGHQTKINNVINFPLELSMYKYCISGDRHNKSLYELFGVMNHIGGTGGGHYYAYVKNYRGEWNEYNDSRVSPISENKLVDRTAYCLFYRLKDAQTNEQ